MIDCPLCGMPNTDELSVIRGYDLIENVCFECYKVDPYPTDTTKNLANAMFASFWRVRHELFKAFRLYRIIDFWGIDITDELEALRKRNDSPK